MALSQETLGTLLSPPSTLLTPPLAGSSCASSEGRSDRARVRDLLTSPALSELLELRLPPRESGPPSNWCSPLLH